MSDGDGDDDRERHPRPDPDAPEVNRWPGRARRIGTDRAGDGIDREPMRSRTRSEWEADGGGSRRERSRYGSPFRSREDE